MTFIVVEVFTSPFCIVPCLNYNSLKQAIFCYRSIKFIVVDVCVFFKETIFCHSSSKINTKL